MEDTSTATKVCKLCSCFYRCSSKRRIVIDQADMPAAEIERSASTCSLCAILLKVIRHYEPDMKAREQGVLKWREEIEDHYIRFVWYPEPNSKDVTVIESFVLQENKGYQESPLPFLSDGVPLPTTTSSPRTLSWLKGMLDTCDGQHDCYDSAKSRLPNRVVDVRGLYPDSDVKLYVTKNEVARYLCLSHCWGRDPESQVMTTQSTLSSHIHQIKYASLPHTFQDAIQIARHFGIDYLWIDSLCIIQHDTDDWQNEAARMAEIYENCYFTIAATASVDSNGGCFRTIPPRDQDLVLYYTPKNGDTFPIYFRSHIKEPALDYGEPGREELPLIHRGWVFQEWALAPRMLHFGNREVVFECKQNCQRQGGDSNVYFKERIQEVMKGRIEGWFHVYAWFDFIGIYSGLDFTFMQDRLPAISALARRMPHEDDDEYLAGIWRSTFPHSLGWFVESGEIARHRPPEPRPPSWSWASVSSKVLFADAPEIPESNIWCEVHSAHCTPFGSDTFGQVKSGRLTIEGSVTTSLLHWSPRHQGPHPPGGTPEPIEWAWAFDKLAAVRNKIQVVCDKEGLSIDEQYMFCPDYQFYLDVPSPIEVDLLWLYVDSSTRATAMVLRSASIDNDISERIGILLVNLYKYPGFWQDILDVRGGYVMIVDVV